MGLGSSEGKIFSAGFADVISKYNYQVTIFIKCYLM